MSDYVNCPHCDEEEYVEADLDPHNATIDRDGDHLTLYFTAECGVCEKEVSIVQYAKAHALEVEG
jgi:transcription elongation factor Elf1